MKFLSVCSGIEAVSVATQHLGWRPLGFSEIEPFPSAVLAHHYPGVKNFGDMTKHKEWILNERWSDERRGDDRLDLLVGGCPCQAFSVAGARRSLDDERGNLTLTFCNIADQFNPKFVWYENVPGILSTKDNAFGCLLSALAGFDEVLKSADGKWRGSGMVVGRRRRVAWVTLDAQYFGVPQRRRRIFVLAVDAQSVADSPNLCPSKILSIGTSLRRDTPTRRKAGEVAPTGFTPSSFAQYAEGCGALRSQGGDLGGGSECLVTSMAHGQANAEIRSDGGSPSLTCNHEAPIIAFEPGIAKREGNPARFSKELCPTLRAGMGDNQIAVAHTFKVRCGCEGGGKGYLGQDEQAFTLSTGCDQTLMTSQFQIRRLTPEECEILQGFPVGYTDIKLKGKPTPDGPRYKALGNSMAVPVMRYIASKIQEALERSTK